VSGVYRSGFDLTIVDNQKKGEIGLLYQSSQAYAEILDGLIATDLATEHHIDQLLLCWKCTQALGEKLELGHLAGLLNAQFATPPSYGSLNKLGHPSVSPRQSETG